MQYRITRLAVEGFKSIAKRQEIEIAPLTILAGANSSGKSSIMQPLLLLKQTLEATHLPAGALAIGGENTKFNSSDEFLSRNGARKLDIEIGVGGNAAVRCVFAKTNMGTLEAVEQRWSDDDEDHVIRPDSPGVMRDRFWLRPVDPNQDLVESLRAHVKSGAPPIAFLNRLIQEVIHVPGIRGTRERLYPAASTGPMFPGTFDYYHASLILAWQKDQGTTDNQLNGDLQHVGIARRVFAHRHSEVSIELRVGLSEEHPELLDSLPDVGFGVSQVLPVLVALRAADEGRLVYLEEPEIHLHPRAQTKLADILAGAAKRGVRVVAETHSSLILRAVQTLVAKGDLDPNLVRLHWFTRDNNGLTQVSSAKLDANGAFGEWPEDFGDVALESEQQYLDAVEDRLAH
jgi:hypothetical protein